MIETEPKPEIASEKIKPIRYQPEEIEARKAMYQHILEAQKCIDGLDANGFNRHISLAQSAVYGYECASELLEVYVEGHNGIHPGLKPHFVRKANNLAVLYVQKGDIQNTLFYVDKIDAIDFFTEKEKKIVRAIDLAALYALKGDVENTLFYVDKIDAIDFFTEEEKEEVRDKLVARADAVQRSRVKTRVITSAKLRDIGLRKESELRVRPAFRLESLAASA